MSAKVSILHQRLIGVSQSTAERQYIAEAMRADGYGLDYYPVKVGLICGQLSRSVLARIIFMKANA